MGDSFLDMAIDDLETRILILTAIKESNPTNDKNHAKLLASMFREMNKGNENLIKILEQYK